VKCQGVSDCAAGVASCGVDEYICGFIDDDYVVVFVEDVERYVFGRDCRFGQFRQGDFYEVIGIEFQAWFCLLAVDFYTARLDDFLKHNPAVVGVSPVEVFIKPAFLKGEADSQY